MNDAPRVELGDEEGKQWPEQRIMELKEVAGPDILRVCSQEG